MNRMSGLLTAGAIILPVLVYHASEAPWGYILSVACAGLLGAGAVAAARSSGP